MIPVQAKLIGAALAVVAAFGSGWQVRGWHEDSVRLAASEAQNRALGAAMQRESDIAKTVEQKLAELKANQTVIDRGVIREIVKPEYRTVCLPDNAVRLLNAAARGEAVPADPAGPVPDDAD